MKKYLVIGNPIKHSLSPILHNYWIKKEKINAIYQKKKLEEQLKEVTKAFLCNPKKNNLKNNEIYLSRIFLWFSKDFGTKKDKINFISKYSGIKFKNPKIRYLSYDWSLNN